MKHQRLTNKGFTLTEVMIVVAIIGLLAAIAIPTMVKARTRSTSACYIGDLRVAKNAFMIYSIEQGTYPSDTTPGVTPSGMQPYLGRFPWTSETSLGGSWDWDYGVFGVVAGVSVYQPSVTVAQITQLDATIDDGNLSSGSFRSRSSGYISILE